MRISDWSSDVCSSDLTDSSWSREEIERFQGVTRCEDCGGFRLKPEALAVKINKLHIGQVTDMSIRDADKWFAELSPHLTAKQNEIAGRVLKEIRERLHFQIGRAHV